jgi:hypothetical protein
MDAMAKFKEALAKATIALAEHVDRQYTETGQVLFDPEMAAHQYKMDPHLTLLSFAELVKQGKMLLRSDLYCDNGHHLWSGTTEETQQRLHMPCQVEGCDHNEALDDDQTEGHERFTYVLKEAPIRIEELFADAAPLLREDLRVFGSAWVRITKDRLERVRPTDVMIVSQSQYLEVPCTTEKP